MSDSKIVKQEVDNNIITETTGFLVQTNNVNAHAVEKVNRFLPELDLNTDAQVFSATRKLKDSKHYKDLEVPWC